MKRCNSNEPASGIVAQFAQPHGLVGELAGMIMAKRPSNVERNKWMLELLALEPTDRLLEIGFGPGIAVQRAANLVTQGLIVGIDHSETMLHQATRRNADAISRGAVQLFLGSVESLPAFDKPFNKICSANVVQFWPDPAATFRQLRSMLASGGTIASTYMPRNSNATDADAVRMADNIVTSLEAAGFSAIEIVQRPMKPVAAVCVLAVNGEN